MTAKRAHSVTRRLAEVNVAIGNFASAKLSAGVCAAGLIGACLLVLAWVVRVEGLRRWLAADYADGCGLGAAGGDGSSLLRRLQIAAILR